MSRTDDLRNRGARDRTGGSGGAGFVEWPQTPPAWVEGKVVGLWETKYGLAATINVTARSNGLEAKGKDEDGNPFREEIQPGMEVNVGLNYAALKESVTPADIGAAMHFAFESWGESKSSGNNYRNFAVLELPDPGQEMPPEEDIETTKARLGGGPEPDDDLPF